MLYDAYQAQQDMFAPARAGAELIKAAFSDTVLGPAANYAFRSLVAGAEIISRSHLIHDRRPMTSIRSRWRGRPLR